MTAVRPRLLGFDARLPETETIRNWPAARRHAYLLRDDVRWPLSVDRSVWPSLDPNANEPQTFLQEAIDLWDSREAMEEIIAARGRAAIPIAIELCHEREIEVDDSWNFLAGSLPSEAIPETWSVVGYDVADRDFVSGLSNCGYDDRDRAALQEWSKEINEFGLLDDVERAHEFRAISDERIPDHAPFFVYRICAPLNLIDSGLDTPPLLASSRTPT